ncbi:uncharacterized protein K452DRAFT_311025 [Aplosporella prunicola CBS 121167]|uniref:Uncharacterized protein n=1 Tax=Aplosporella prunicola CBS 121167 TaxID=1176127 RepID=A0A6A6B618_9PEZI|nr:uncharacterized protein K452DRAFT_311025 [Aplosporella prunicola CBS 121167]KAF2139078.1 hypothetical protein K452DRAFT_311025 [Aplosporella prunicola CBS 121167]
MTRIQKPEFRHDSRVSQDQQGNEAPNWLAQRLDHSTPWGSRKKSGSGSTANPARRQSRLSRILMTFCFSIARSTRRPQIHRRSHRVMLAGSAGSPCGGSQVVLEAWTRDLIPLQAKHRLEKLGYACCHPASMGRLLAEDHSTDPCIALPLPTTSPELATVLMFTRAKRVEARAG